MVQCFNYTTVIAIQFPYVDKPLISDFGSLNWKTFKISLKLLKLLKIIMYSLPFCVTKDKVQSVKYLEY